MIPRWLLAKMSQKWPLLQMGKVRNKLGLYVHVLTVAQQGITDNATSWAQ